MENNHVTDLTGLKRGKLTIIGRVAGYNKKWECRGECGNFRQLDEYAVLSAHFTSCGCVQRKRLECGTRRIGEQYGYLTIKNILPLLPSRRNRYYECECRCGKIHQVSSAAWKSIRSCGCIKKGEKNSKSKFTNLQVKEIRKLAQIGYSQRQLANIFRSSKSTINYIVVKRTYKDVQ